MAYWYWSFTDSGSGPMMSVETRLRSAGRDWFEGGRATCLPLPLRQTSHCRTFGLWMWVHIG
eukprot:6182177-Pleurochrysis_carterae.AAC.1